MRSTKLSPLALITVSLFAVAQAGTDKPTSNAASVSPQSFAAELTYLDANGDGRIDARELANGQQMASMMLMLSWDACDRNQDGQLTPEEFEVAATEALQSLSWANSEADRQAEEALANAVPLRVLLQQLGGDPSYADELNALRQAVEDVDDDDTVITHVISNPTHYPRLSPVVRTWTRYYPVKSHLRRNVRPNVHRHDKPANADRVRVGPKHTRKPGKSGVTKSHRPHKSAKPKAGGRPRSGGRRP